MTSLSTLLSSLQKSSTKSSGWGTGGASGWGGSSSTWGGKSSSYVKIPKFGKVGKTSESQAVANKIMSGAKAKASHSNESVLGSILGGAADVTGNLVKDVISTAENVPTGLYKIATTNPKDTLHAIGADYKTRYGKLFSGDFGGFLHQVEQHPLSYGLDVATVATAGGAGLAKAGVLSNELSQTGLSASRAATAVGDSAKVGINLSRNPTTRLLQKGTYALQHKLPESLPIIGEKATANRAIGLQFKQDLATGPLARFKQAVTDVHALSPKGDDTLTQAFDVVNNDVRHRPLQTFGQGLHTPASRSFDPKTDFAFHESGRHSAEIEATANKIKSEITVGKQGAIAAKEGASPEAKAFVEMHNARMRLTEAINQPSAAIAAAPVKLGLTSKGKAVVSSIPGVSLGGSFKASEGNRVSRMEINPEWAKNPGGVSPVRAVEDTSYTPATANYSLGKTPATEESRTPATRLSYKQSEHKIVAPEDKALDKFLTSALSRNAKSIRDEYKSQYGEAADDALNRYNQVIKPGGALGKSTQVWKDLVLAGRPAFQVNNFVGNQIMFHLRNGLANKSLQLSAKGDLTGIFNKYFSSAGHTFGGTEKGEGTSLYRRAVNKSYNLQGKHETILRRAAMRESAMSIPEIKTAVRQNTGMGMSETEALDKALHDVLEGPNGQMYRQDINKSINDTMGDYSHYSAGEQRLKKVVPFYGWNRHSSRFLAATARDDPHVILALNQISKQGESFHDSQGFAGTPDFMQGYLKVGGHVIDTAPLNPLKGGTDTLKSVKELVNGNPATSGGDLSGNLNPFIAAGIQSLTGKSLLTGAPISKTDKGLVGSVLQQTVTGLPQYKIGAKLVSDVHPTGPDTSNPHTFLTPTGRLKLKYEDANGHVHLDKNGFPTETPGRHMLNPTTQSLIATFLGVPDRGSVNQKVAKEVEAKIKTTNNPGTFHPAKKRKKKPSFKSVTQPKASTTGWGASQSGWGG